MYLLLLLCLVQPPHAQGKGNRQPTQFEIPTISPTNANQSAEYIGFLWRLYNKGIEAGSKENRIEYAQDVAKLARVYTQLSVTWEGTATAEAVKLKDNFPPENMVLIRLPIPTARQEQNGKLIPLYIEHNEWSKKIRPNTKVIVKAFIEDIRFHNNEFVVVLSHVTLAGRKP